MKARRSFFPVNCHPTLSRRDLLLAGGAMMAAAPFGAGARVWAEGTAPSKTSDGTAIIERYATAPDDPWMVAHGLRAMGSNFMVGNSRRAVDYLLENFLVSRPANGGTVLGFPSEVEVHANMFLKTMLEAGVPLDYAFTLRGNRHTLSEVVEGARALLRPALVASVPNALPWTIIALTRTTPQPRRQWTNAWGESVDLDALVESALRLLEEASLPLAKAMREGRPMTEQAPVHNFTCGGGHMIYALLAAARAGYGGKDRRQRIQQQVDVLVWRLSADLDLMERFYEARERSVAAYWYEFDAKLKHLGHAEECLAFAARHKVASLTPAQHGQWQAGSATLHGLLATLEARGAEEARGLNRELYRQVVGDTCHARHGFRLRVA